MYDNFQTAYSVLSYLGLIQGSNSNPQSLHYAALYSQFSLIPRTNIK